MPESPVLSEARRMEVGRGMEGMVILASGRCFEDLGSREMGGGQEEERRAQVGSFIPNL